MLNCEGEVLIIMLPILYRRSEFEDSFMHRLSKLPQLKRHDGGFGTKLPGLDPFADQRGTWREKSRS